MPWLNYTFGIILFTCLTWESFSLQLYSESTSVGCWPVSDGFCFQSVPALWALRFVKRTLNKWAIWDWRVLYGCKSVMERSVCEPCCQPIKVCWQSGPMGGFLFKICLCLVWIFFPDLNECFLFWFLATIATEISNWEFNNGFGSTYSSSWVCGATNVLELCISGKKQIEWKCSVVLCCNATEASTWGVKILQQNN